MNAPLDSGLSGRDDYARKYRDRLDRQAEWLRRMSSGKVEAVRRLCDRNGLSPGSILEVGAGTGAVIGGLAAAGVGEAYFAVDYSRDAVEALKETYPHIEGAVPDVTETPDPFGLGPYDLTVVSHVVEHLEEPERFLRALSKGPVRHAIVEVPLENLAGGRLKARLKDRADNPAGHVQFSTGLGSRI